MASAERAGWTLVPPGAVWDGSAPVELPLRCWLTEPADAKAGVLLLPEVFGINHWVRGVAARLADAGYASLAVPLFARTAPELELAYSQAELLEGRRHKELTTAAGLLQDIGQAARWFQHRLLSSSRPVSPSLPGLGCVGFCFGGHVALLAATLPEVSATASFYGAGVARSRPGGGAPSLEMLPMVQGHLRFFLGRQDPLIPPDDVALIQEAVRHQDPSRQRLDIVEVDAGHGYMCESREDYDVSASADGWRQMLQLFASTIAGP